MLHNCNEKIPPPLRKCGKLLWYVLLVLVAINLLAAFSMMSADVHKEKLWLHRTNSLEKLHEKEADFTNFEVDLVFRDSVFDVTHDADTTFHLSLESYMPHIRRYHCRVWLDIKNLNSQNADCALFCLDSLVAKYHVDKSQFIVETRNISALSRFTDDGFYTSYYVNFPKPSALDEAAVDTCIAHLRRVADSGKVCALSFPGWWYKPIRSKLHRHIDLLTWKHRTSRFGIYATLEGRAMLFDPQLKVILVKSKGKYHR